MKDEHERRKPELVIIAALAEEDRLIGRGMDLPWHLPEDLRRFKRLTSGYPLVVGRKTFASIVHQFGGPLPNRRHLILSRQGPLPDFPDIEVCGSIDAALAALEGTDRAFIGGGGEIYAQFLGHADRMELTLVEGSHSGDAYFPAYEHLVGSAFEVVADEPHPGFRFVTYRRIG